MTSTDWNLKNLQILSKFEEIWKEMREGAHTHTLNVTWHR